MTKALCVATLTLLVGGCRSGALPATPDLVVGDDMALVPRDDDMAVAAGPDLAVPPVASSRQKVDILFMVDNSPSTAPKQAELRVRFANFATRLQGAAATHPASYHIGVVTSDLGAGPFTLNNGQCHPGGDGAKLQVAPAAGVTGLPAACTASFTLGGGVRFIDYNQVTHGDNLGGVDLTTAFSCISAVGELACGFESPLESVYQALHDPIVENTGFLRADALLVVVYVTDEDDCSAPATSDLFDPSANGSSNYGVFHSFRCTQYGIVCGNPPQPVAAAASNGPLTDCRPRLASEGGKLIDVQKYIDYFTLDASQGGVKIKPADVIVAALAAPVKEFSTSVTSPCVDVVNVASCAVLDHSCVRATDAKIFGDPAVRLNAVVSRAATWQFTSICDNEAAGTGLDGVADKILARLP